MKIFTFSIPGKAVSKERPRRGRYGNFYTPQRTQSFELRVHTGALQAGLRPLTSDNIGIGICFYGQYGRSDIDNLVKSTLDGLKYFFNDNKVNFLTAKKIPSKEYSTKIKIW